MKKEIGLLLVVLMAGCSDVPETDIEGLKAMRGEWESAFNARDAAAVAAVYATNGAVHPPNAKTIKGRGNIQAYWAEFMEGAVGAQINDTEVHADGNVGYKVGTYMVTDPAGAPLDVGKYIEIWHSVDGKWQLQHDIFNSDMPVPAPPAAEEPDDETEVFDEELEMPDEE